MANRLVILNKDNCRAAVHICRRRPYNALCVIVLQNHVFLCIFWSCRCLLQRGAELGKPWLLIPSPILKVLTGRREHLEQQRLDIEETPAEMTAHAVR